MLYLVCLFSIWGMLFVRLFMEETINFEQEKKFEVGRRDRLISSSFI